MPASRTRPKRRPKYWKNNKRFGFLGALSGRAPYSVEKVLVVSVYRLPNGPDFRILLGPELRGKNLSHRQDHESAQAASSIHVRPLDDWKTGWHLASR